MAHLAPQFLLESPRVAGVRTQGNEKNLDFPPPTMRQNPALKQGLSFESPFANSRYAQIHPLTPQTNNARMFT